MGVSHARGHMHTLEIIHPLLSCPPVSGCHHAHSSVVEACCVPREPRETGGKNRPALSPILCSGALHAVRKKPGTVCAHHPASPVDCGWYSGLSSTTVGCICISRTRAAGGRIAGSLSPLITTLAWPMLSRSCTTSLANSGAAPLLLSMCAANMPVCEHFQHNTGALASIMYQSCIATGGNPPLSCTLARRLFELRPRSVRT